MSYAYLRICVFSKKITALEYHCRATLRHPFAYSQVEAAATRRGGEDPIIAMIKSKKKASHAGPLGQLKSIEPDLLHAILELYEQEFQVNTFLVVVKASVFSPEFNVNSFTALCSTAMASCVPIRLSIKWACMNCSASLRKLRGGRRTTCVLYAHLSLAIIVSRASS